LFLAHNGNPFDFPILFEEIRCALSNPAPCMNNNSNNCTDEMEAIISNDNIPVSSLPTNGSSLQTTSTDIYLTSLLSIECADSLVFFREMQQSINDKNTSQHEINNIPSESLVISNQNGCNNNALTDPMELTSSPVRSTNNNNSSSLHGYGKMPSAYIPSPDPARPQPSMKLVKIYEREFHQKISHFKSHRAEDDCLMLLAILKRYLPAWLEWIAMNHKPLSNFFSLSCTTSKNIHRKLL
jgi:regulator of replication initiation timing